MIKSKPITVSSALLFICLIVSQPANSDSIANPLDGALCDTETTLNLLLQAESLSLIVLDRSRLNTYLQEECDVTQGAITMSESTTPDLAAYSESLTPTTAESFSESTSTEYTLYGAADMSRGNRHENEYAFEVFREQALLPQLLWSVNLAQTLLEDIYTEDFFTEDDEILTLNITDEYTTLSLSSALTYQSETDPKKIGFTDISYVRNDFTGVKKATSVSFGGGYAIWGEDYHADCAVLKYSAGLGHRGRELFDGSEEQRNFVSQKVSLKYPVTDSICVSVKHTLNQFVGHSNENMSSTSVNSNLRINELISLSVRYFHSQDKGVQSGFEAIDERLRFGVEVAF